MKIVLFAWICASVVAVPALSATAQSQEIEVSSVTIAGAGSELELSFLDRSPVESACDYYVSRFEYVSATHPGLLLVDLRSPEPCLIDSFGRRSGQLKWTVPSPIRGVGCLTVIVNGQEAGELRLSGNRVHFISR